MTTKQRKIKAVISSIAALILCFSMMLGVTMAWFTDTTTNNGNRIVTGGIGVELWKHNGEAYVNISDGTGDIFVTEGEEGARLNGILWEPGKTEVVYLQVKNSGNLALNYNIILDIQNDSTNTAKLNEVLTYAIIPGDYSSNPFTSWEAITNLGAEMDTVPEGETTAAEHGALKAGESDFFALAVHMDEDAANNYQHQGITIDVKIAAKQMASEDDSFGNQYDAEAGFENKADEEEEDLAPRGNLLVNPGFETPNAANPIVPDGWKRRSGTWGDTLTLDQSQHKEGNNSIRVGSLTGAALDQDIQWTAGRTYVMSGYFMVSQEMIDAQTNEAKPARASITLTVFYNDNTSKKTNYVLYGVGSDKSPLVVDQSIVTANTWIPFSFEIEAPSNSTLLRFAPTEVVAGGVVWFDDLCVIDKAEIVEEEPEAPANLLLNADFETVNKGNTAFENWGNGQSKSTVTWGTTIAADKEQYKTGAQSVKISSPTGSLWVSQGIEWEAGSTYEFSGYYMVSEDMTKGNANVVVAVQQYNNKEDKTKIGSSVNYILYGTKTTAVVSQENQKAGEWIPFSFTVTANASSTYVTIQYRQFVTGGTVWFDNLSVKKVVTTE